MFQDEFDVLKRCDDLGFLKRELDSVKKVTPECSSHMLYLNNKIGVISHRIKELEKSLQEVFG